MICVAVLLRRPYRRTDALCRALQRFACKLYAKRHFARHLPLRCAAILQRHAILRACLLCHAVVNRHGGTAATHYLRGLPSPLVS